MTEKRPLFQKISKFFGPNADNQVNRHSVWEQIDRSAALDSFKTHWSQAYDCMTRKVFNDITVDDITSIVNHIDQMVSLLLQENDYMNQNHMNLTPIESNSPSVMMSPLLDYLLIELVLEKLLNWSEMCGEWHEVMVLEQLKLYELLVSQICHNSSLFQTPIIRPLLTLLSRFVGKVCHLEVEKRLVVLLNTLFVTLSHNLDLLDLFFLAEPLISSHLETKFLIFSLLIPFVHRDGPVGQQARDAILLCMALSRKNESMGRHVADETDFCPVLATGLSGLYSSLPRRLLSNSIFSDDWHQITNEDIHRNPELEIFVNSLEFCNAVAQIAHPLIQKQLLQYIYNGFLVPVIAPALHQEVVGLPLKIVENLSKYSNTLEEIISTTSYFDLFVRTITEPNLLKVFLQFICVESYEEQRILNTLITRISAHSKLCLVTLVLFRSLVDLNCEDVLIELVLKYLTTGNHIIGGKGHQSERINDSNYLNKSAQLFLTLIPKCCFTSHMNYMNRSAKTDGYVLVDDCDSISNNSADNTSDHSSAQELQYLLYNYLDYLKDANIVISNCIRATRSWSSHYDACSHKTANNLLNNCVNNSFAFNSSICANNSSNNDHGHEHGNKHGNDLEHNLDHVNSNVNYNFVNNDNHFVPQTNGNKSDGEEGCCPPIGDFMQSLLSRLESLCENDIYTNLQLTGLVSRLAAYPQPLFRSLLLNPSLVFQSDVKSLPKILTELSKKLDQMSTQIPNFDDLLRKARHFLYSREHRIQSKRLSISAKIENEFYFNSKPIRSNSITSLSSQTGEVKRKGFKGLKDLFRSTPRGMRRSASELPPPRPPPPILESVPGQGYRYFKVSETPEQALDANEVEENERIQRIVLAAIVYEEFVRELSAISYEHFTQEYSDPTCAQKSMKTKV